MSTSTQSTQIVLPDDVPAVRIIREFNAPAAKVFRAHMDPDLFVQWIGPEDIEETEVEVWDARSGGEWRYVARRAGEEFAFRGCFHDVRPDQLIVQTFTFEGWPDSVSLERCELEDLGGGRCRLTATSMVDSFANRDALVASGMEKGVVEGYRKLDDLLARD